MHRLDYHDPNHIGDGVAQCSVQHHQKVEDKADERLDAVYEVR